MKFIVAPILILLIISQAFSKWILIAEFNMFRSYIAKNLCENRYRPQLHCNGKCVLMKKMRADENQSSPSGNIKLNWETFLFVDTHTEYLGKNFLITSNRFVPARLHYHCHLFIPDVFRPPLD
jgi:hypothetical protein